jgi:hypothetical protein
MAITQKNNYSTSQNLSDLTENVDANRLGDDRTNISVNFGTTPATVSIKQGSWIEANGNLYVVDSADYSFQMSSSSDNYIYFNEAAGPPATFTSGTAKGTYRNDKIGTYQANNTSRTIRWYVDQTEETYNLDDSLQSYNIAGLKTEVNSYKVVNTTTGLILKTASFTSPPTGNQVSQTEFFLKKPVTLVADYTASTDSSWSILFELEFNSTWLTVATTGGAVLGTGTIFIGYMNPGNHRFTATFNTPFSGKSGTVNLYMIGVYGQTNFDAASVYV